MLILAAVVFVALGVWSATDENWSGVIVSIVLAIGALLLLMRRQAPR